MRANEVGSERAWALLWRSRTLDLLLNTLALTLSVTSCAIVLGTLCAFFLARYHFWGKRFFQVAITLPMCIPAFVSCFTWISLTFRMEGFWGSVMILTLSSFPLTYLPVAATLKRLDRTLQEVSFSLGRSSTYTFWQVIFPQLKPAIGSSILLIALHMLVEFGAVSILNYPTLTTAIFQEYEMSFDNSAAALFASVLTVLCVLVVLGEMRFRGSGKCYYQGKGVAKPYLVKTPTKPLQGLLVGFFSLIIALSLGVPVGMLLYWLKVGSSWGSHHFLPVVEAFAHSLMISLLGAFFTVLCALPLVWAAIRYRSAWTIWIERLPYLLHAVPGIVIALSLTYFTIHYAAPFYQTFAVVVLAYFMLYLPMAQTTLRSALEQIPVNIENVGKSLGRPPFYIFCTLTVPAMLPGLTAAFALVFLTLMKELTATILLTSNDVNTLSTAVWEFTSDAQYAAATPYAIALILFSGIPVFVLKKYAFK